MSYHAGDPKIGGAGAAPCPVAGPCSLFNGKNVPLPNLASI